MFLEKENILRGKKKIYELILSNGPFFYLFLSVLCISLGIYGGQLMFDSSLLHYTVDDTGWDELNWFGFVLQNYLIPYGCIFLLLFILNSYKNQEWHEFLKIFIFSTFLLICLICCILSWLRYSSTILNCGIFLCFLSSSDDDTAGLITISGTFYVIFSILFLILFGILILRLIKDQFHSDFFDSIETSRLIDPLEEGNRVDTSRNLEKSFTLKINSNKIIERIIIIFGIFFPFCIWISLYLPNTFEDFNIYKLKSYASEVEVQDYGKVWNLKITDSLVLKLYPDILGWWLFIYSLSFFAILGQIHKPTRLFYHQYIYGWRIGEILIILYFSTMFIGIASYWYFTHGWHSENDKTNWESFARTAGQMGNICLSLLYIPTSRNSIWNYIFGISWETMIKYHRWLGNFFFLIILIHMLSWWFAWIGMGNFPHDIFTIIQYYNTDNYTITITIWTTLIASILIYGFSFEKIRRQYFELFFFSHYFHITFTLIIIWHGASTWYFLLPNVTLYLLDRIIRFLRACTIVKVQEFEIINAASSFEYDDDINKNNFLKKQYDDRYIRLSYLIENGGKGPWGNNKPITIDHSMGQFVFLNIPDIDPFEWHPYTIFSSPGDQITTHIIKSMGKDSWSDKLATYADLYSHSNPLSSLIVNIDGPYGLTIDIDRYDAITFVGGGIGITPLNSYIKSLYHLDRLGYCNLQKVKLIWVTPNPELFVISSDILNDIKSNNHNDKFSFHLYKTGNISTQAFSNNLNINTGRPDLWNELIDLQKYAEKGLVFVCGPNSLMNDCKEVAIEYGIDIHTETFLL